VKVAGGPGGGRTAAAEVPKPMGTAAEAAVRPGPPAPPQEGKPDTYGFQDLKDRVEAGPRYDVQPPEERPPRPPRANPAGPLPVATPVYDPEKSRGKWTPGGALEDLKGMLPLGLGNKLQEMKDAFAGGSNAAKAAGAGSARAAMAGVGEMAVAAGPAVAL